MTFAAVNSDDSLLQVINEYNFESVSDCNGVLPMDTISRRRSDGYYLEETTTHACLRRLPRSCLHVVSDGFD